MKANTRVSNLADDTIADAGETCERVPEADLPDLLRTILPDGRPAIELVPQGDADGDQE
jgi:hypothetical protein